MTIEQARKGAQLVRQLDETEKKLREISALLDMACRIDPTRYTARLSIESTDACVDGISMDVMVEMLQHIQTGYEKKEAELLREISEN